MIEEMPQVHMSDAEVAKNFAAVLERVRHGVEIVVEQDARPVAVIKTPPGPGRHIDECIAIVKARNSRATMDEGFGRDVEEAIRSHQEPWNPPSWD